MDSYKTGKWDLSELPRLGDTASQQVMRLVESFAGSRGKLRPTISHVQMMRLVSQAEKIHEKFGMLYARASLSYAADTQSDDYSAAMASMGRMSARIANEMIFFNHWWKLDLDERNAKRLLRSLGELQNHFAHMRLVARHTLPEAQERIINTMEVTGSSAMTRLYDKITSAFTYRAQRRKMTREELTALVRNRSARVRKDAYTELLSKFHSNRGVLGDIYSSIVTEWDSIDVKMRSHDSAISVRNMANDIDDRTVSALLATCKKNARVFRKFFTAKAKELRLKKLRRYDLYAPSSRSVRRYAYDAAVRKVLSAMSDFDPRMSEMAQGVFSADHVDSSVRRGKRDGAFCSTVTPSLTPYVLLSYTGTSEDMFTLAHELGHAVHSVAASSKSILVQDAPLPVAETASTFSEMLLYDHLVRDSDNPRSLIFSKIDSLYATIMRQSFFTLFEMRAHELVSAGASVRDISEAYMKNLREQFGASVNLSEDFADEWVAIPHFYHSPFYCYAYSFGNLMALSLFSRYKREGSGFSKTYLELLGSGGSQKPEDLMSDHGFDIRSEGFWQEGFDYVAKQVDEL